MRPVVYQIYVDAFARGSSGRAPGRRRGGDLEGLLERLDYVAGLGVDAVWLTPIFPAPSDHGYDVTDYFRVDPRLAPPEEGAAEALFTRVVDSAHRLGLKVLLDLPLNHVGHGYDLGAHPGHAPRTREARTRQERGWRRDLKYLDHDDEETRRFLFAVARHWVERHGVDGYRYDYVHGVANPFWEALYAELRSLRADLFVVGEHWDDLGGPEENARDIASRFDGERGPCFDTLFDFPFQAAAVEALATGDAGPLAAILDLCDRAYPRPACAMLDNHDTARVGDWVGGDERRLALGLRLLASRPAPICLLYGTEVGLRSGRPPRPSVDDSSRVPMDWGAVESPLAALWRRLCEARRRSGAIAGGRVVARSAEGGVLAERLEAPDGAGALVVLNFSDRTTPAGLDISAVVGGTLRAEAACGAGPVEIVDGRLSPLPPFGGGIYQLTAERDRGGAPSKHESHESE